VGDTRFDRLARQLQALKQGDTAVGPGGMPEVQLDLETGEPLQLDARPSRAVMVRQRDPGYGTAHINMEGVWFLCLYLKNQVAVALVIEAARRYKLEMGPLALTYALQQRLGLTKRSTRTALYALQDAGESLGWIVVTRSGHRAATIEVTELGFQHLWANSPGKKGGR
jgi:hypothetical protein